MPIIMRPKHAASCVPDDASAMRLIVVSGLSGSGKSVALHMLEDVGFYCIDNIPAAMLKPFIAHTVHSGSAQYARTAVGLDARNEAAEIATVPKLIDELKQTGVQCEVVFLLASDEDLLRRFAETRRKHPMSTQDVSLKEAIAMERRLLRADHLRRRSRGGYLAHGRARLARTDEQARRAALERTLVHPARVVRLQERHSRGRRLRVRRAFATQSVLGHEPAGAHRAAIPTSSNSSKVIKAYGDCWKTSPASSKHASLNTRRATVAT